MLEGLLLLNDFVLISVTFKDKPRKLAVNNVGKNCYFKTYICIEKLLWWIVIAICHIKAQMLFWKTENKAQGMLYFYRYLLFWNLWVFHQMLLSIVSFLRVNYKIMWNKTGEIFMSRKFFNAQVYNLVSPRISFQYWQVLTIYYRIVQYEQLEVQN